MADDTLFTIIYLKNFFQQYANKMTPQNSCKVKLHYNSVDKKTQLDVTFVFFISLLIVAQHVSGNHVEQLLEEK